MYLTLSLFLKIYGLHKLLASIPWLGNYFTKSHADFFYAFINAEVKAYRIIYAVLLILLTLEPQSWWKVLIMMVTVESSVKIATPIANWTCVKIGIQ